MGKIVTGSTMPLDLQAVLQKYGMPKHCTGFRIECKDAKSPLNLTFSCEMWEPDDSKPKIDDGEIVVETRQFQLHLVTIG